MEKEKAMFIKVLKWIKVKQNMDGNAKKNMKEYGVLTNQVTWMTNDKAYYELNGTEYTNDTRKTLNNLVQMGLLSVEKGTATSYQYSKRDQHKAYNNQVNIYFLTDKAVAYINNLKCSK